MSATPTRRDFHPPGASLAEAVATFWTESDAADRIYRAAGPRDEVERCDPGLCSLRWALVTSSKRTPVTAAMPAASGRADDGQTGE